MKIKWLVAIAFSFLALLIFLPLNLDKTRLFYIEKGASITRITQQLYAQNISYSPAGAKWFFRGVSWFSPLQSGEYALQPGMNLFSLARLLVNGERVQHSITFLPGHSLYQIINRIHHEKGLLAPINNDQLLNDMEKIPIEQNFAHSSLEGLLFPDTYSYEYSDNYKKILLRAYQQWKEKAQAIWLIEGKNSPYDSLYQASIVASLIEKEAKTPKDKKLISGVIQNRLCQHMPLQIDATVIYALGNRYQGKLSHADMRVKSPYNTYIHRGLPPTPIALFTMEDLQAALHPAQHDFLYYVLSKNNREHLFANNYQAHRKNIRAVTRAVIK